MQIGPHVSRALVSDVPHLMSLLMRNVGLEVVGIEVDGFEDVGFDVGRRVVGFDVGCLVGLDVGFDVVGFDVVGL